MKLVTFRRAGKAPEAGVVFNERVVSLAGAGYPDVISLLAQGEDGRARVENWIYNPPTEAVTDAPRWWRRPISTQLRARSAMPRVSSSVSVGSPVRK